MQVAVFPLGPLHTNCYVIHRGQEAVVVDPGGSPEDVEQFLDQNNLTLTHILCSHLHFDHTYGIAALQQKYNPLTLASEADRYMLDSELGRGGIWGLPLVAPYDFTPAVPGTIQLLGTECRILPTPGHTPGGLSYYIADMKAVFSGDELFFRSVGRSDFPGGNHEVLVEAIHSRLFTLPDETRVYAGHGDATTIGDEKLHNPHVSDGSTL